MISALPLRACVYCRYEEDPESPPFYVPHLEMLPIYPCKNSPNTDIAPDSQRSQLVNAYSSSRRVQITGYRLSKSQLLVTISTNTRKNKGGKVWGVSRTSNIQSDYDGRIG